MRSRFPSRGAQTMRPNRRRSLIAALLLCASVPLAPARRVSAQAPAPPAPAGTDPKADQVAAQVWDALGGKAAWGNTHCLHWTFAGRRAHTWDKWTGQHRVEGEDK